MSVGKSGSSTKGTNFFKEKKNNNRNGKGREKVEGECAGFFPSRSGDTFFVVAVFLVVCLFYFCCSLDAVKLPFEVHEILSCHHNIEHPE